MDHNGSSTSVLLVSLQTPSSRSASPMTPSPSRDLRGVRLFRAISRKLGRRSQEDLSYTCEDDSRSSSTDSCSSTSAGRCSRSKKSLQTGHSNCSSGDSEFRPNSPNHISSSSSETGSDSHDKEASTSYRHRHHHSTTAASFRKVFANLTLNARSHSCSDKEAKRRVKKTAPKRILRPPVTYTYVRGISGLPTQRIPRSTPRTYTNQSGCNCGHQYLSNMARY